MFNYFLANNNNNFLTIFFVNNNDNLNEILNNIQPKFKKNIYITNI